MAKYYGKIGYAETVLQDTGVWVEKIVERTYTGDVLRNSKKYEVGQKINDDLNIANRFSILSDPYALQNFHTIRYITWMGTKWKVNEVEVNYPRLTLQVGGIYNGYPEEEETTPDETGDDNP